MQNETREIRELCDMVDGGMITESEFILKVFDIIQSASVEHLTEEDYN